VRHRLAPADVVWSYYFGSGLGYMSDSLRAPFEGTDDIFQPKAEPTKILLTATTRWPSAARLLIEFSKIGHIVSIVCPPYGHPSQKVRVRHKTFPYRPLTPLNSLADAIEVAKPDLIVPCDDLAVRHLHQLHSRKRGRCESAVDIPSLIVRSLGPPESYAAVTSRYLFMEVSREEAIRTPDTRVIANLGDFDRWRFIEPFPWVLKCDGSTGGNGVRIAHTLAEAQGYFLDLHRKIGLMRSIKRMMNRDLILESQPWYLLRRARPAVVVQSLIRGYPANCAVVCWKGEVLAGVCCEAVDTETRVGPATVVRLVDNAEMMGAARKIASRLSLSGFFGLDFVIEEGTGAAYLIELNPRSTPPCHLRLGVGRDMIGALSAQLTKKPLGEPVSITHNSVIAYFPQALLRNSDFLSSSYHDVPEAEPELVEELCRAGLRASRDAYKDEGPTATPAHFG
jgi:ATP-grasp domain